MLTRFRIEVEGATAEECVDALMKYEHAMHLQEARRYRHLWPVSVTAVERDSGEPVPQIANDETKEYPTPDQPWEDGADKRHWYSDHFGREVTEEVIEYDESIPGYRGRRVISFSRIDDRREPESTVYVRVQPFIDWTATGLTGTSQGTLRNEGSASGR